MFLTFWLRTKNTYFNVKSELTEKAVFKQEIKTEFVQGKDELISGRFSKPSVIIDAYVAYDISNFGSWLLKTFVSKSIWMVQS